MLERFVSTLFLCLAIGLVLPPTVGRAAPVTVDSRFGAGGGLADGVQDFLDTLESVGFGEPVLVPSAGPSILQAVDAGEVDLGIDIVSLQQTGDPDLDEVLDVYGDGTPFGLQTWEHVAWMQEEGVALLEQILVEKGYDNVGILPVIPNTGQAAGMSRDPLHHGALTSGLVVRAFGHGRLVLEEAYPATRFVSAEGGSPGNIVAGFNAGMLDAAEFVNPCIDQAAILAHVEPGVVEHYYLDNWQTPVTLQILMYRRDLVDDGFDLDRLRAAQRASLSESQPRLMRKQSECLADIQAGSIQIDTLPHNVLEKLRSATFTVLRERAAANPELRAVLESRRRFIRHNQRWLHDGPLDRDSRFEGWSGYESDL